MARLLALGDSHLEALEFAAHQGLLDAGSYAFAIVPGATAVGLRNPNALTNAVNIFKDALVGEPRESHVLVHLGEVDCGFVIWWRAKKYGESVESQFRASIDAYGQFLSDVVSMGFRKLCIVGASLPTIRDGASFGEVANKRSEVDVGIRERTDLTISYNEELRLLATKMGFGYLDLSEAVLDRDSRLIHDFFRSEDAADHHLDKQKVAGVWAAMCNRFLADDA
jgi:hypothetical protein